MPKTYFLESSELEAERLDILHEAYFDPTNYLLEKLNISPKTQSDITINDFGCATGLMTKHLASCTKGMVNAIDFDNAQIAKAKSNLAKENINNVKFYNLDLTQDLNNPPIADLTYCRFVLHHLPSPKKGIENLINCTKVGGYLLIADPIIQGTWSYPWIEEVETPYKLLMQMTPNPHWDPDYGKKLYSDLLTFSNIEIENIKCTVPILSTEKQKLHHVIILKMFKDKFLEKNIIDENEYNALSDKLINLAKNNNIITSLFGMLAVVIKRIN